MGRSYCPDTLTHNSVIYIYCSLFSSDQTQQIETSNFQRQQHFRYKNLLGEAILGFPEPFHNRRILKPVLTSSLHRQLSNPTRSSEYSAHQQTKAKDSGIVSQVGDTLCFLSLVIRSWTNLCAAVTSKDTKVTPETQRSTPDYLKALKMRKMFDYQRHTRTSLTANIPARMVGDVHSCTHEPHDDWWGEYKIEIKPRNSTDVVEAWTLEKQEVGTTVQFCCGRMGLTENVYTWFETRNGDRDPHWRSNLL